MPVGSAPSNAHAAGRLPKWPRSVVSEQVKQTFRVSGRWAVWAVVGVAASAGLSIGAFLAGDRRLGYALAVFGVCLLFALIMYALTAWRTQVTLDPDALAGRVNGLRFRFAWQ